MNTKKLITLIFTGLIFYSCSVKEVETQEVSLSATTIQGELEVPIVFTTATGSMTAKYSKATKVLNYTINYTKLTPTAWHIHKGAVGTNGSVVFNLGTTFTNPFTGSTPALTTEQETDLLNGMYYINIHSAKFPNGEIRGQIIKD